MKEIHRLAAGEDNVTVSIMNGHEKIDGSLYLVRYWYFTHDF